MIFECTKAGVETRVKVGLGEIHILLHISKTLNICFASAVVCSGYSPHPIYIIVQVSKALWSLLWSEIALPSMARRTSNINVLKTENV